MLSVYNFYNLGADDRTPGIPESWLIVRVSEREPWTVDAESEASHMTFAVDGRAADNFSVSGPKLIWNRNIHAP